MLLVACLAVPPQPALAAGSISSGGWPGAHMAVPQLGPAPQPHAPGLTAPTRPAAPRAERKPALELGVTPLQRALTAPPPEPQGPRSPEVTQQAVDKLMQQLGVESPPREAPFGARCARWERNLKACLD